MTLNTSETVWKWRESTAYAGRQNEKSLLRRQAVIQALVTTVIGFFLQLVWGHHAFAVVLWFLAGIIFLLGIFWPLGYHPIRRFGVWLGKLGGGMLLYILLVPLYYLLFSPVSLWLRVRGHDPLQRALRDPRFTCWIRRTAPDREPDYERQFLIEDNQARDELRLVAGLTPDPGLSGSKQSGGMP